MEQIRNALLALTHEVCQQLDGMEIPKKPVWTVVTPQDASPYVAMDVDRPVLSDLRMNLSIGLLRLPEYGAAADAFENDPELREGIVVDASGFLHKPERINLTRALVTNFLWRYLREGARFDWDETRFNETFDVLLAELRSKRVVLHTTLPLSNLKVAVASLDFGDELTLMPASTEELEQWLNRDQSLPGITGGPPHWDELYVDRPGVLHTRRVVIGQPRSEDVLKSFDQQPKINANNVITALRLVMNAPISVIFQENHSEGLIAFGGGGTSWGWSPPPLGRVTTLDQEKATQVIHMWQLLQKSPNIELLRLPLRRWESSLLRPNLEDKLIDAWISLEALMLRVSEGELSFRAAVRVAEFLGTSGADRKAIYDATRISYDWRSVIVHGGNSTNVAKRKPLQETVHLTSGYLRSALLKVLDLTSRFDPSKLDADLLSRGSGASSGAS